MPGSFLFDLRVATRGILKRPGFSLSVVLILALGIGAVTVMFSTLWGVVLRPLPYPDADRLVWAWATTDTGQNNSLSALDYFDYRDNCDAFESLAARLVWRPARVITGDAEPERVVSTKVSANLFATLGVAPLHGRSFVAEEEVLDGPNVVMVSHGFWQRRLGADAGVVGTTITIDGAAAEVVGVMPDGFDFPSNVDLWFPMLRGGPEEVGRGNNNFFAVGRLADGVSLEQAQAQIDVVAEQVATGNPESKQGWGVRLVPLHDIFFGDVRPVMLMLMGATALLLLIACANLSSLFLAKVTSQRREFAVRLSLGASSWIVVRQVLTEALLITSIGAIGGIGLAALGIRTVKALAPSGLPRLQAIGIDGPVLLVAVAATVLSGLLFGMAPALQGARVSLLANLWGGRHGTESRRSVRLRSVLVAVQVALSLVLLVGSGLLLRSSLRLQQVDPGFEAHGLLTIDVQLPTFRYADEEPRERFAADALARLRALPGVRNAAAADQLPLFGGFWNGVYRDDKPPQTQADLQPATRRMVSDRFFQTLGIALQAGRGFEPTDRRGGPPVTVISRGLAERLFPGEEALGRILVLPWGEGIPLEIVGIADDVRDFGLDVDFRPVFYLPISQYPREDLRFAVRAQGEATALAPVVRAAIQEVEKDAALYNAGTMQGWLSASTADVSFTAYLLGTFAAIALLLAATGIYGVMAYIVTERTREIGIRVALGAGPASVMRWVLIKGLLMAGSGLVVGLVASLLLARLMQSLLFEIGAMDPVTYLAVCFFLALVALAACAVPALRAVTSDPCTALRSE